MRQCFNLFVDLDLPTIVVGGCTYSHTGIYPDQETVTKLLPEKYTYMERNREVLLPWLAAFKTLQEDDPNPPSIDEYKKSMPTLPIPYEG